MIETPKFFILCCLNFFLRSTLEIMAI